MGKAKGKGGEEDDIVFMCIFCCAVFCCCGVLISVGIMEGVSPGCTYFSDFEKSRCWCKAAGYDHDALPHVLDHECEHFSYANCQDLPDRVSTSSADDAAMSCPG